MTGTVTVTVGTSPTAGDAVTTNPPKFTLQENGAITLKFLGIPGRIYQIQRSTDMSEWATIASVTANGTGAITFTDDNPPQPNAFYRLALP